MSRLFIAPTVIYNNQVFDFFDNHDYTSKPGILFFIITHPVLPNYEVDIAKLSSPYCQVPHSQVGNSTLLFGYFCQVTKSTSPCGLPK
jgi:hypothetical protein